MADATALPTTAPATTPPMLGVECTTVVWWWWWLLVVVADVDEVAAAGVAVAVREVPKLLPPTRPPLLPLRWRAASAEKGDAASTARPMTLRAAMRVTARVSACHQEVGPLDSSGARALSTTLDVRSGSLHRLATGRTAAPGREAGRRWAGSAGRRADRLRAAGRAAAAGRPEAPTRVAGAAAQRERAMMPTGVERAL